MTFSTKKDWLAKEIKEHIGEGSNRDQSLVAGFDMALVDKLFTPFQRLHAINQFPGMGIGLATVKRVITRHNERIWSEAAVDHGATFFFTLGETKNG
jgi:light-regulated signal transduction histidine kinase (bacteriophytochrome)